MTDVRLKEFFTLEGVTMDWLLKGDQIADRDELATSVRVALGTDAEASETDILPNPDSTDRRGWWGNFEAEEIWGGWPIGTKSWLLSRAKITQAPSQEGSTLDRAQRYTEDALQPFIDKRIATEYAVRAVRTEQQRIEVYATMFRGPLDEIDLRYQMLWLEDAPVD